MTPLVAVAKFLKGWTVYFHDGRVTPVFHDRCLPFHILRVDPTRSLVTNQR